MKSNPVLTDKNHADMDVFLGEVLERHKAGELEKSQAIGILAHVMAALDLDNYDEAVKWFEQGRKFIQQDYLG
ncbi:hypothetical protein BM525_21050 (plasmid) [Alteromonas mediterranea]|uniref:Uncharacterized protein n=1 Tax=Alteromonas mediterranea TaxID=314275 RepID=A0AAC9JEW7_9ALTE|nr:hypothetical protein [Alteromonas mediterranea]APD92349.1 hypothetical protein BM524_20825 [Alteromonas mediterranea]APE00210.1 hypothetical protein BM525_21050 [Alteromonas mediterranea]